MCDMKELEYSSLTNCVIFLLVLYDRFISVKVACLNTCAMIPFPFFQKSLVSSSSVRVIIMYISQILL